MAEYKQFSKDGQIRSFLVVGNKVNTKITIDGQEVSNPTLQQFYADGWVEYITPAPSPAQLLEQAKQAKLASLNEYDSTPCGEVNVFYVNDNPMWMDKAERTETEFTIRQVEAVGGTEIPYKGFVFPVAVAKQLIAALEVYALQAYGVTENHKTTINALETVEAIEAYDYTVGYPEKLHFTLNA